MMDQPQTSTPLKLAIKHFLQRNGDSNLIANEEYEDNSQNKGTRNKYF